MYKQLLISHEAEEIIPWAIEFANTLSQPWALFTGGSIILLPLGTDINEIADMAIKYIKDHGEELCKPNDPVDWTLMTLPDEKGWVARTTKSNWFVYILPDDIDGEVYPAKVLQTGFNFSFVDWTDQEVLAISDGL